MNKRMWTGLFAALALTAASIAAAQQFPQQTIRLVIPYGPGGAPDVMLRLILQKLSESMGQQVIVDNRPGASGIIAAEIVMKAPADGYTLFVADTGHVAINPALRPKLPYDPLKDFAPVTLTATVPLYLITNVNVAANTVAEFIALSKEKGGLLYGSSGNGSPHHLAMESLKLMGGANLTHVPYKGVTTSVPAVLAGDVSAIIAGLPSVRSHVQAGKLRVLGSTSAKRSAISPEVPAIAETVPGLNVTYATGILAPAGTPRAIIDRLNAEINKALKAPEITSRLLTLGIEIVGGTPEEYAAAIRQERDRYGKLVKDADIRID